MFDLRSKYAFDASESQIAEGGVSPYGHANDHANCIPASFTEALILAGLPDIDPQRITNDVFGPTWRSGFGDFSRAIDWIRANVPGAPAFSDGPFEFDAAEAAGQAGRVIIVAGWIDGPSVTFKAPPATFSHASLLVAHLAGGKYVIWNTWTGQLQTYDRAVLAASLYEMAVMQLKEEDVAEVVVYRNPVDGAEYQVDPLFTQKVHISPARAHVLDLAAKLLGQPGIRVIDNANVMLDQLPDAAPADSVAIMTAIADLKAHGTVVSDPVLSQKIDDLSKHLGIGTA